MKRPKGMMVMNIAVPTYDYPLMFAFGILLLTIIFIPRDEIRKLFWLSVLLGSGLDLANESGLTLLGITWYDHTAPFKIGLLPLWTILAWAPAVMLFIYFIPQRSEKYIQWLYIFIWSVFSWFVAIIFNNLEILVFLKGGPWIWFILGMIYYPLIIKYYQFLQARSQNR